MTTEANPDEVTKLGNDLSVDVEVSRQSSYDGWAYDDVQVSDPSRPAMSKVLFSLDNIPKSYDDRWANCRPGG